MRTSQNQEILDYFRKGRTLTSLQARKMFGTIALNSRVSDLRNKLGVQISDTWIKVRTRNGPTWVKRYYIDEDG